MVMNSSASAAEDFRAAWDAHHQRVRQYLSRRVSADDIDELTAQVFEVAWRRWNDVPDGPERLWWLLATAHRTTGNYYRSRTRRGNLAARLSSMNRPPVEDAGWTSVENVLVRDVLAQMTVGDREVLILSVWDDLDVSTVALVLGVSTEAAQKRITRARDRFKVLYGKSDQKLSADDASRTLKK